MTKREMYDVIAEVFATVDREDKEDVLEMVKKEVAALDRKAATARKKASEKKAAGDELRERISAVIGEEPITVEGILDALGEEGLTPAKVTARTKQLVDLGVVEKKTVKIGDRKLMGYYKA